MLLLWRAAGRRLGARHSARCSQLWLSNDFSSANALSRGFLSRNPREKQPPKAQVAIPQLKRVQVPTAVDGHDDHDQNHVHEHVQAETEAESVDSMPLSQDIAQLQCAKCLSPLCATSDLIFFKWSGGIHLSSVSDSPLERLRMLPHPERDQTSATNWKHSLLHCIQCNHKVGILGKVMNTEKILFSAADVSVHLPETQSPLLSLSGYPSSHLTFSSWSELIATIETQTSLKSILNIQKADILRKQPVNKTKALNKQLLLCEDIRSLLELVRQEIKNVNHVNLLTALNRISKFSHSYMMRRTPSIRSFLGSEAPEDDLLVVRPRWNRKARNVSALESDDFWFVVNELEKRIKFSAASFRSAELVNLSESLNSLRVGNPILVEQIAKLAMYMHDQARLTDLEALMIAAAITKLASPDLVKAPWLHQFLNFASDRAFNLLDTPPDAGKNGSNNSIKRLKALEIRSLVRFMHGCVCVDFFDQQLIRRIFEIIKDESVWDEILASNSVSMWKVLQVKVHQVYLDCVLRQRFNLLPTPSRWFVRNLMTESKTKELKQTFEHMQHSHDSFRANHLINSTLTEMDLKNYQIQVTIPEGYLVNAVLRQHKVAILLNSPSYYLRVAPKSSAKHKSYVPLTLTNLKFRHLQLLGWTVLQLPLEELESRLSVSERVEYVSTQLEMAISTQKPLSRD